MSWGEQYDQKVARFAHIHANPSQPETSKGTCLLPNGNSVEMGADECARQKGHWSPNHSYVGWRNTEEPGEIEDPGESPEEEAGEESAEGAAGTGDGGGPIV